MGKLENYKKQYPDTIKATAKHSTRDTMSLNQIRSMANSIHGKESAILEARTTKTSTTVFVSKDAFEKGVRDQNIQFG